MAKPARFASSNEPLQIFQDELLDENAIMTSHAPMPSISKPSRRPLGNSSSNVVLNPPSSAHHAYSPHKTHSSSPPRSPFKSPRSRKLHMVHMAPPGLPKPMTDSLQKKPYLSKFKTASHKTLLDTKPTASGKENVHPTIFPAPATMDLSLETTYTKPNGKRGLLEAAPIKDERPAKKIKSTDGELPSYDCFPPICDDGTKPPHSYAQLIGMAILRSPMRRLTLAQIYKWISDNYSFYNPNDAGWQNSIRHNLSLHKNFIKIERPKDDPGKGNYWGIEPGTELQFLKEKQNRKSAPTAENLPVMSTRMEPSRPSQSMPQSMQSMTQIMPQFVAQPTPHIFSEPTLPPAVHIAHTAMPGHIAISEATLPADLSSDATIPASDNNALEESADQPLDHGLIFEEALCSPLPDELQSSPPMGNQPEARKGTPPPAPQIPVSSGPRSHRRKFASMDDSGYISSLESSVMRPNAKTLLFTSEADLPRVKRQRGRGRAEEEIARIRHSSPYSPSKGRSQSIHGPMSSSPLRPNHETKMLPPLTPRTRLPAPAPPTASPNTHLRLHRAHVSRMLQSPLRQVTGTGEDAVPWSPAFNLDVENVFHPGDGSGGSGSEFDIFKNVIHLDDIYLTGFDAVDAGSPLRRSAKRGRLDRSVSTSQLEDVMKSGTKRSTASSLLRAPNQQVAPFLETPSKAFEGLSSPSRVFQQSPLRMASTTDDTSFLEFSTNDFPVLMLDGAGIAATGSMNTSGLSEVDILQGFEKIGAEPQVSQQGSGHLNKPPMARSYSTSF